MRAHRNTSWEALGSTTYSHGVVGSSFTIGEPDDPTAPLVGRFSFPPGVRVGPHTHDSDYAEIILEGSQQVSGVWHHAGDVRIVRRRTAYGPLISGPEGVTVLVIFRHNEPAPIPVRPGDDAVVVDVTPTESQP